MATEHNLAVMFVFSSNLKTHHKLTCLRILELQECQQLLVRLGFRAFDVGKTQSASILISTLMRQFPHPMVDLGPDGVHFDRSTEVSLLASLGRSWTAHRRSRGIPLTQPLDGYRRPKFTRDG